MKKILTALIACITLSATLALTCGAARAEPSAQQIEAAITQGNWQEAATGLQQVLAAHPDSARAHYLYAQVLGREGQYDQALAQLNQAQALDPQLRFTTAARFAQVQARLRAAAARAGGGGQTASPGAGVSSFMSRAVAPVSSLADSRSRGPSTGMWVGLVVVIIGIVFVLRRTLRRTKASDDAQADTDRRDQLKRATDLLNATRSLKLDIRLSTMPGHETLEKETEDFEAQLRAQVEAMTNGSGRAAPSWQLDALERQFESLKARAEGRQPPDAPNAQNAAGANASMADSAYAREADANFGAQGQPPYPGAQPPQQPPVIVQQGGGMGGMGGLGGLLGGVLLGQVLGGGRGVPTGNNDAPPDSGIDFGQGGNDWGDNGSGSVDLGSNDDSGGWNNS